MGPLGEGGNPQVIQLHDEQLLILRKINTSELLSITRQMQVKFAHSPVIECEVVELVHSLLNLP